jgi:hypothetical protein
MLTIDFLVQEEDEDIEEEEQVDLKRIRDMQEVEVHPLSLDIQVL